MVTAKRALLGGLAFVAALGLARPVHAQDPDVDFRNGVAAFEQGRLEEAEQFFRNVLKTNPSHEQALRYRDEAGYHFWVKVLARGGRLGTVAQRLLKSAEKGAIRERQDLSNLREDMRPLWSDDYMEQIEATERLVAIYGHYVVPELVEVLSDRHEDDKRVRAIQLLARLGAEGTLAVVELLESDSIMLQQNAAAILGHTRDIRAVPPLMRLAARTSDPHVKEAANKAVSQIGGPSFGGAEFYARVAEAFYREEPLVMVNRYREYVVWKWKDGKLTRRDVPRFRWNEEVAEEYCYDGLDVDPKSQQLWALLLNVYAQEWTEIEESLRVARQLQDRGGEVDMDQLESVRSLEKDLAKVKMLVASRGADAVLAALGKALADQRATNAVFLIERLQEMNIPADVLATGGAVTYLPPSERTNEPAATAKPAPRPAAPAPQPSTQPTQPAREEPKPTRVEDPKPARDEGPGDGAPSLDDDVEEDAPSLDGPRRRPRRVSQLDGRAPTYAQGQGDQRVTRMGFRNGGVLPQVSNPARALETGSGEILTGGEALSAALAYGDKRVRYAAAIALAHLNPAADFANSGQVMTNLVDALSESGQRVVLVVERDRHARNRVLGLLRELGYMAFGVESGRDGLMRAKGSLGQDLIIVSSELNPDGEGMDPVEFQFVDMLREDYRTAAVKIMILTPEDRVTTMQSLVDDGKAIDVLTPEINKATLSDKLTRAFGNPEDERDEKSRSDKIAERAALALATLSPGHTVFDSASAAAALARNVRRDAGRPDAVRLACLEALSAVGPAARGAAFDVLVREFQDTTNSIEVRRALPKAIGECAKGGDLTGDAFQALKAALAHDDEGVWDAAGHALGKAKLTEAQALEVFKAQRLE